ncbi:hypothetical protein CUR178_01145 [Leishmania enriettii]|uniref:Uncharacterized protein n=1 Tax=Leishmania enriettii TaxID=5663 RepID=A0A836GYK6_LEIEN|nr:hypothetical protein CUR178_01145 [Leishmania enriettii]
MQATLLISHSALPVGYCARASTSHLVPLLHAICCVARGAFKASAKRQENLYLMRDGDDRSGETKRTEQMMLLCQDCVVKSSSRISSLMST